MPFDAKTDASFAVFFGYPPSNGPKIMPVFLDFTTTGSNGLDIPIDLEQAEQRAILEFVQSISIDNTLGGQALRITASLTGHTIQIAAGRQAILPIMAGMHSKFIASTGGTIGTGIAKTWFQNFPVPAIVW